MKFHVSLSFLNMEEPREGTTAEAMADDVGKHATTRLELVQALRLSTTLPARKIELAYKFVDSLKAHGENGPGGGGAGASEPTSGWMKMPQVVGFLSEWVQSALIRSSKPGATSQQGDAAEVPAHLDTRYWSILKFCLSSGYLHRLTSVSPTLMRTLTSTVSSPLSQNLIAELNQVMGILFTEYDRPFRSNLDSWVSLTAAALNLLRLDGRPISVEDSTLTTLVSTVVEGFSKTVALHPNPTKVFQVIVARLLEPLLTIIAESLSKGNSTYMEKKIATAAREILANGLFHAAHVGGFSEVCVFLKGSRGAKADVHANGKDSESRQRSYHRTFFQKLNELRKAGNFVVLTGLGHVFKMYAQRLKAQWAALSEDIYGVRGQGKPQAAESNPGNKAEAGSEAKPSEQPGLEKEAEKNEDNAAPHLKKQATETDALFTVFAELLGPLKVELEDLTGSEKAPIDGTQLTEAHIIQISSLMRAVSELLEVAKEVGAYKSLEDTPSLTYLNFLQEVHDLVIKVGTATFDAWSNMDTKTPVAKKKKRLSGAETRVGTRKEIGALSSTVIFSLRHLLQIEYSVFEQQLPQIWPFLFKMVASNVDSKTTTLEALEFGRGLLNMYSDLRQVDIPIFHLAESLTGLLNSSQLDVLSTGVENIICAKPFLAKLGSVIHKVPEGQVTQLLKKLTAVVTKTLETLKSQESSPLSWELKIFDSSMQGLVEVYTCILENAHVTSSNSVLAGGAVRELLMKVLAMPLTKLVDVCCQDEDGLVDEEHPKQEGRGLLAWKSLFLLTLYSASRTLHRQCLLLMPPKAAKKASAGVSEIEVDFFTASEPDVITFLKESRFLMSLQRGSTKVSKLLRKLAQKTGTVGSSRVPAMGYMLNIIALRSLVELDCHVRAAEFLSKKTDLTKKLSKVLRSLKREGAKLVTFMLDGLDRIGCADSCGGSAEWDGVMATLDSNTVIIARWGLVCETTDVWSKYAIDNDLKNFVMALLRIGRAFELKRKTSNSCEKETDPASTEDCRDIDLDGITRDLLSNLEFYENEGIRRVFASAFLLELRNSLLWIFEKDTPIFTTIDQCIESTSLVIAEATDAEFVEKVKMKIRSSKPSHHSATGKDSGWTEDQVRSFGHYIGLFKLLQSLPRDYLHPADIARCAYTICQLEKLLVDALLNKTQAAEPTSKPSSKRKATTRALSSPSLLVLADGLTACRSALGFLADSLTTSEPDIKNSAFTPILFGSSTSAQCLTLLPEAVASCLLDNTPKCDSRRTNQRTTAAEEGTSYGIARGPGGHNGADAVHAVLQGTCAVVEALLGSLCAVEAKLLVCPKPSPNAPAAEEPPKPAKKRSTKLKGPLVVLGRVLVTEAQNVHSALMNEPAQSGWFGPLTAVAAINSALWSMTNALESVDEECRNSKSAPLVWRTELPESWVHVISELEPILVRILLHVLFPAGAAGLAFFSKSGTKAPEVDGAVDVEVDAVEEDTVDAVSDAVSVKQDVEPMEEDSGDSSDEDSSDKEGGHENEEQEVETTYVEHSFHVFETVLSNGTAAGSPSPQFSSLQSVLEANASEKAMFVGELYMAVAAVVKLRGLFSSPFALTLASPLPPSPQLSSVRHGSPPSLDSLVLAAYWLLSGSAQLIETRKTGEFGWLVGVVKYMGAVGAYLPCMKPFISPIDYIKLINLHVRLLGVITVLRKDSSAAVAENLETADWDVNVHELGAPDTRSSGSDSRGDQASDLEAALRKSFERLLKYAPRQHMVLALQSVEKAMAGVWGGSNRGSGLEVGGVCGCLLGTVVAAGVECLGLSLQAVSGKMRLHLLASHCPAFFGGLFNLLGHLQGPSLFFTRHRIPESGSERLGMVDAAPVALRAVEILTTLAARAVIFPMKPCYVALALQAPATLFRPFYEFGKPKSLLLQNALLRDELRNSQARARWTSSQTLDENSVKLYVACCRLLCALLRHRLRECGHSMALLGESCRVLLQSLTAPSWTDSDGPPVAATARAAHCGSWLRRVYEEMGEHKETMGKYCCHLLADYLNVLSGYSLGGIGLKREVDGALRPGAFALLDACSGNDLQQLHATLGEGSRRSALMTLRRDYDLHYKYTGKV